MSLAAFIASSHQLSGTAWPMQLFLSLNPIRFMARDANWDRFDFLFSSKCILRKFSLEHLADGSSSGFSWTCTPRASRTTSLALGSPHPHCCCTCFSRNPFCFFYARGVFLSFLPDLQVEKFMLSALMLLRSMLVLCLAVAPLELAHDANRDIPLLAMHW